LPESNAKANLASNDKKTQQGELVRIGEEEFMTRVKASAKKKKGHHQYLNQGKTASSVVLDAAHTHTHTSPRRSSLSKCHTVSRYTPKYNFIFIIVPLSAL
jgi:hypothetical protein